MTAAHDAELSALLRYYHDCVAAQLDWSRALNVLEQKDVVLLGLTRGQQQALARHGRVESVDPAARELAKRASASGADTSLTLGLLFLCGTLPAAGGRAPRRICAPLLMTPLETRLDLRSAAVELAADRLAPLSLNYGLLAELLGGAEEGDELADQLAALAEIAPDFPIEQEEFDQFWSGFVALASELPIDRRRPAAKGARRGATANSHGSGRLAMCDFYPPRIESDGWLRLLPAAAAVLGHRDTTAAAVLGDLQAAASMPLEGTALATLFRRSAAATDPTASAGDEGGDELESAAGEARSAADLPLPLPLTETQRAVVLSARSAPLTVVTGPPGTGKSYTITAIVLDALQSGRSVLVASQMEKAVQVVVDQVEKILGELAVARSGGRAAQRALAKKLMRLTGPKSSPPPTDHQLRQADDAARQAEQSLADAHRRFRDVVDWERQWSRLHRASEQREPACPLPIHDLAPRRVAAAQRALRRAQAAQRPDAGWLLRLWRRWNTARARKALQAPAEWEVSLEELDELLQVLKLRGERRRLEQRLRTPLPANALWDEACRRFVQRNEAALNCVRLARRRALSEITRDASRRAQLRQLATLLRRRRRDLKRELKQGLDARVMLWGFPIWACTSRTLNDVLPAEAGLFDLVVIDEASQCDPATAAAALLRGRRAVVVGDPEQLRHVCFLSRAREDAAVVRCQLPPAARQRFHFRRSLFDIAADAASADHFYLLTEHFRSHPQIIGFSNRAFYEGQLRVMTARPSQPERAVRVVAVDGRREPDSSVNRAEIEMVLSLLRDTMQQSPASRPVSLGVVSPFRDHVDAIRDRVIAEFTSEQLARHAVVVGTAHSLQGDERDVVVLSTSIDLESHAASLHFLQRPSLFNVAVTRARHQLLIVTSVAEDRLPAGLLRRFLEHARQPWLAPPPAGRELPSLAEAVRRRLAERGLDVWPGFAAGGETIDLAAAARGAAETAVLLDHGESRDDPLDVHLRLARAGWRIRRLSERSWLHDWPACIEAVAPLQDQRASTTQAERDHRRSEGTEEW